MNHSKIKENIIKPMDLILIYLDVKRQFLIQATAGLKLSSDLGNMDLGEVIGKPFGYVGETHLGKEFYILKPSSADLMFKIKRKTTIVYPKDLGYLLLETAVGPGSMVIDIGTGSGALALVLAKFVAPDGMVWVPGFGSGVFGKFDPTTERWTVYELPDAENQIPNALNIDKDGIVWEITLSEEEKNFLYNVNETHNRFFKDSLFRKKASQIFAIISIFIISVFIFVLSFWIAGFLGKDLILPIENLMLGTEELKRGNYRFKIQKTSEDELGVLIDNFNKMSSIIQTARDEQSKLNENLQTERDFQNAILTSITTGIGIISAKGDMIFKNPSLEAILQELESPEELEKSISKMLSDKDETMLKKRIRIGDIFLSINILNFRSGKSEKLLIVDDFTEILNLRRAEIWQAMARKLMHELKNPLTPISLAIDRLRRKRSQDPAGFEKIFDENTAIIKEEIDRLSKLLKHFNDFAKLPAPHLKKMSLEKLLGDLIKLYSDKEDKNVSIHLRTEADDAMIEGDQILLKQLFVNLLNNSLDSFKGGKGTINILLKGDERTVYVEFSDNGIGIAKKDLDKIWDIYFSGKKSGTGLGLTMVQRIIEDHSGRISVRSSLKTGTVFDIEFRRRQ